MPKINLSTTATQPKPVDVGVYDCRLTNHKFVAQSAASGQPYVNFEFTGQDGEAKGRKFFGIGSLSEDGIWKFKSIMVACGVDEFPEDFDTDSQEDVDTLIKPYYGAHIPLAIGQEEAKNKEGKPQGYMRNIIVKYGVEQLETASTGSRKKAPF